MEYRPVYSTSANSTHARQLAYNDYQLNHHLHQLATLGSQNIAQQQAAQVPSNQVDQLQLALRELEKTRTAQVQELAEIRTANAQISATLVVCFGILAFYADPETWKEDWFAGKRLGDSPAMSDRGARARTMMKNIEETK